MEKMHDPSLATDIQHHLRKQIEASSTRNITGSQTATVASDKSAADVLAIQMPDFAFNRSVPLKLMSTIGLHHHAFIYHMTFML